MAKVTLEDLTSLSNPASAIATINENMTALAAAIENTLSRDGAVANQMEADIDLNGYKLLNVDDPEDETDGVNLRSIRGLVAQFAEELVTDEMAARHIVEKFVATASQTTFVLEDGEPANISNTYVFDDGVHMIPAEDYSLVDGNTIEFAVGRTVGHEIVVRYLETLAIGEGAAELISFQPLGTGARERTVQDRLHETSSVADFPVVGNGLVDDADVFEEWIDALQEHELVGWVPKGTYLISTIRRRALTKDLKIVCHPEAVFVGASTKQEFAGAGQTSFVVTTFLAGFNGFRVVHIDSLGVTTVLTEDTHYTVTGQVVDTSGGSAPFGTVDVGETLRVVSANAMIELGANAIGLCSIDWQGGYIDASARGYAENTGSGSGIVFYNASRGSCKDTYFYASDNWEDAVDDGLGGDSGVTTIACDNFEISGNIFEGWSDLGTYATGNSGAGEDDDGVGVAIHNNGYIRCQSAASIKRDGVGHIHNNWARECRIGFSFYPTGNNPNGARGSIHDNFGLRIGRIFIDVRSTAGVSVHDNTVVDLGFDIDGVTPTSTPAAFNFLGVDGGTMHDNVAMLVDWPDTASQRGIGFGADTSTATQTTNSTAHHNKIIGFATGINETGTGTGNVFRDNELISCTTPVSVLSSRRWHYRESNIEHEGIGAVEFEGSWTPVAAFANGGGSFVHTTQFGRYVRRGNLVHCVGRIQFTATHTETTAQLRISGLPYTSKNLASNETPGVMGYFNANIVPPANCIGIVPKVVANVAYVRLDQLIVGGTPVDVQGSHITTAVANRFDFAVTYEVEPEAAN